MSLLARLLRGVIPVARSTPRLTRGLSRYTPFDRKPPVKATQRKFGLFNTAGHSAIVQSHINAKRDQLLQVANGIANRMQHCKSGMYAKLHTDCWDLIQKLLSCTSPQDIQRLEASKEHRALAEHGCFDSESIQSYTPRKA